MPSCPDWSQAKPEVHMHTSFQVLFLFKCQAFQLNADTPQAPLLAAQLGNMDQNFALHQDMKMMKEVLRRKNVEDWNAVRKFWDSSDIVEWFRNHGYTLYRRIRSQFNSTAPTLPFDEVGESSYPYAYHNGRRIVDEVPLCTSETSVSSIK